MTDSKESSEYFESGKAKFASGDYQGAVDDLNFDQAHVGLC